MLSTDQVTSAVATEFGGGNMQAAYDHTDSSGNYVIQVYEVIIDDPTTGASHTATDNWYTVDPITAFYTDFNGATGFLNVVLMENVVDAGVVATFSLPAGGSKDVIINFNQKYRNAPVLTYSFRGANADPFYLTESGITALSSTQATIHVVNKGTTQAYYMMDWIAAGK